MFLIKNQCQIGCLPYFNAIFAGCVEFLYSGYMSDSTLFHKIVSGEIPSTVVYETDDVLGFKDIHPKAPIHILFIAKKEKHFTSSIIALTEQTEHVPCMLIRSAQAFAKQEGIEGYKLTFHCGAKGGQEVEYLHLHFLSK